MSLEQTYAKDKPLLKFYKAKLLEPGWAGELNNEEYNYIRENLKANPHLKTRWGFVVGRRKLSEERIRDVALNGTPGFQERFPRMK